MSAKKSESLTFKSFLKTNLWLIKVYWNYSPKLVTALFITSVIMDIQGIVYSFIFAKTIDQLIQLSQSSTKNFNSLIPISLIFLCFYIITNLITRLDNYISNILSISSDKIIRVNIHKQLITLGIQSLESPELNNLIERAHSNIHIMYRSFIRLPSLFGSISTLITASIVLIAFAPAFIPVFILFSLPLVFIDKKNMALIWKNDKDFTEIRRRGYDSMYDLMNPKILQELIVTNGVSLEFQKFHEYFDKWVKAYKKIISKWYSLIFIGEIIRTLAQIGAYTFVFWKFILGNITVGTLTFMVQSIQSFSRSVIRITLDYTSIFEQTQRVEELKSIFELKPSFNDGPKQLEKLTFGPSINFNNVNFIYPKTKKRVIENLNLNINPGEKIAIVGHNGAGKTTLVKLICRFYQINSGSILINNIDINNLNSASYYQNLSVVFQEYNTYSHLTASENIYIGDLKKGNNKNKIIKAAKKADAHEFIKSYDNGYDKILSERYENGIRPSTGQWQKIALARFFFRDTALVIFDEPTAAIDAVSEKRIFNKIYNFFKGKTVIIISHRFSTVRNADRIIVMDHGKIIEHGSHQELIMLGGKYAHAFNLQAEGYSK